MKRTRALVEASAVLVLALLAVALAYRSAMGRWERTLTERPYAEYLALGLVPLAAMAASRRPLSSFGIRGNGVAAQFDDSLKCLLPFAAGWALVFLTSRRPGVQLIAEPLVAVGVIAACARVLKGTKSQRQAATMLVFLGMGHFAPSALVFYPLLLGPGEELLFRGYIQSRLNAAFGRPWQVLNTSCGAGLLITAALFAAFHVINMPALVGGRIDLLWATALPTFAWGLAFGYLRERTESLIAPAVVHGVPQAIAWAFLGR